MAKGISVSWLKSVQDPKAREELELAVRNSTVALSRLYDLIVEKELTLNNSEFSIDDFKDPAWANKQAFRNGQRASLKSIRELLEFIKG